jgi:hypothetical protein
MLFIAFLGCVLQVFSMRKILLGGDEQDFLLGQSVASRLASGEYSVRASFFFLNHVVVSYITVVHL